MTNQMTIGKQVAAGFAATLFGLLLVAVVATAALNSAASAKDKVLDERVPRVTQALDLESTFAAQALAVRGYLISGDDALLRRADDLATEFNQVLAAMEQQAVDDQLRTRLAAISEAYQGWDAAADGLVAERRDAGGIGRIADQVEAELFPGYRDAQNELTRVVEFEETAIADETTESDRAQDRALTLLWVVAGLTVLAALILATWVTRRIGARLTDIARRVDAAAREILAGVSQQVSGATEQAAAVQQTVATVDELVQTAEQAVGRAQGVADRAQESVQVADEGTQAIDDSTTGMVEIRSQVESIAASILELTQRAQAIGEVVDTVEQIAAQTHLLALNAAIEAARAGEHGRGFAVVAGEVKNLADQSKTATSKVSQILSEIEEGTGAAVIATEEGTKSTATGEQLVRRAGDTITQLGEIIAAAALAAEQIAASSRQQAAATVQISEAMRNVDTVMEQNVASARQAETTAQELTGASHEMKLLVGAEQGS